LHIRHWAIHSIADNFPQAEAQVPSTSRPNHQPMSGLTDEDTRHTNQLSISISSEDASSECGMAIAPHSPTIESLPRRAHRTPSPTSPLDTYIRLLWPWRTYDL
jgi:hypothetical protein